MLLLEPRQPLTAVMNSRSVPSTTNQIGTTRGRPSARTVATGGHPGGAAQLALCATAAFAMGMQSAAVRALGVAALSSTFFTGTLTDVVRDLARGPRRWSPGASGLAALVAGAAAQGALLSFGALRLAPLLPLALVGAVAVLSLRVRGEDVPGDDPVSGDQA